MIEHAGCIEQKHSFPFKFGSLEFKFVFEFSFAQADETSVLSYDESNSRYFLIKGRKYLKMMFVKVTSNFKGNIKIAIFSIFKLDWKSKITSKGRKKREKKKET